MRKEHALSVIAIACLLSGCDERMPDKYLIPSSYEGVVVVLYDQPGFPAIPTKDGYLVYKFPDDGIIITSSKPQYGSATDQTLDVLPDGSHRRIPHRASGERSEIFSATGTRSGGGDLKFVYFYMAIGSDAYWQGKNREEYDKKVEEAFKKLSRARDQNSEPSGAPDGGQPVRTTTNPSRTATGSRR